MLLKLTSIDQSFINKVQDVHTSFTFIHKSIVIRTRFIDQSNANIDKGLLCTLFY